MTRGKSETRLLQKFFEVRREYGAVRRKYEELLGSTKGLRGEYGKYGNLTFSPLHYERDFRFSICSYIKIDLIITSFFLNKFIFSYFNRIIKKKLFLSPCSFVALYRSINW